MNLEDIVRLSEVSRVTKDRQCGLTSRGPERRQSRRDAGRGRGGGVELQRCSSTWGDGNVPEVTLALAVERREGA